MNRLSRAGALLGFFVLLPSIASAIDDIPESSILYLASPEKGGIGLLWKHRGRCWLISAGHVLESSAGAPLGHDEVEESLNNRITLEPYPYTNLGLDIIAYQVGGRRDDTMLSCVNAKPERPSLADPLDLLSFNEAGGVSPLSAEINDIRQDVFLFELRSKAPLPQGLSGAPLFTSDDFHLVGFTTSAEGASAKAIRADFLESELEQYARSYSPPPLWRDPWFWTSVVASAYIYDEKYHPELENLNTQRDLLRQLPQFTAAQQRRYEAELATFDSLRGEVEDHREELGVAIAFTVVRGLCWWERYNWSRDLRRQETSHERPMLRRFFASACQGINPWGIL